MEGDTFSLPLRRINALSQTQEMLQKKEAKKVQDTYHGVRASVGCTEMLHKAKDGKQKTGVAVFTSAVAAVIADSPAGEIKPIVRNISTSGGHIEKFCVFFFSTSF